MLVDWPFHMKISPNPSKSKVYFRYSRKLQRHDLHMSGLILDLLKVSNNSFYPSSGGPASWPPVFSWRRLRNRRAENTKPKKPRELESNSLEATKRSGLDKEDLYMSDAIINSSELVRPSVVSNSVLKIATWENMWTGVFSLTRSICPFSTEIKAKSSPKIVRLHRRIQQEATIHKRRRLRELHCHPTWLF